MKKKFAAVVMLIMCIILAAGCGKSNENNNGSSQENPSETTGEGSMAQGGSEEDNNHFGNTGKPGSEAEGGYNEQTDIEGLRDAVIEVLGDSYWPNMSIPADMLEETYGIEADMYEEYLAECPMISVNVDTLIVVKAKEEHVKDIENALEAYREAAISESMQYPQNLGKIQASRIETFGNYVCFVQLGADTTAASDVSEEAVIDQCLEENERAIDAIEKALLK